MATCRLLTAEELDHLADAWNALAGGIPFRRHEWLSVWWRHYGAGHQLYVLCVEEFEPGSPKPQTIGLAPFYLQSSLATGRVLRLLGDGEACSDYVGLLCAGEHAPLVAAKIADWLFEAAADRVHGWDAMRLQGIDAQDAATACLADQLEARGCLVHRRHGPTCWRLELPADWATYEALLSKSHRKQVRRLIDRVFDSGRAALHTTVDSADLPHGEQILIDLHQRRRRTLGEPGCFSSASFKGFHQEALQRMLAAGLLRLHWLELDGQPAAAEYHLAGSGVIYAYQSGVAPELLDEEPGRLAAIATLRLAIEQGFTAFDFLRGDEPYKAHFRAQPRALVEYRIAAPQAAAQIRHRAWDVGERMKDWWRAAREDASGRQPSIAHQPEFK